MIMMAITKVKAADEAEYRVVIENEHGRDEANFMLFVSGDYPMSVIDYKLRTPMVLPQFRPPNLPSQFSAPRQYR